MHEPLLTEINAAVDDIYTQIVPYLNIPYAFYGHSLGSLLAYLLTKKIILEKKKAPIHLFFSGRHAPSVILDEPNSHSLPRNEFITKLKELGGSPDELLNNEELLRFFEPILRADFKLSDNYIFSTSYPFHIPITVMIGTDEKISEENVSAWQKETTLPVRILRFKGDHFFIFNNIEIVSLEIVRGIKHTLNT
jgi:surfactin synthase thioesterase subunit